MKKEIKQLKRLATLEETPELAIFDQIERVNGKLKAIKGVLKGINTKEVKTYESELKTLTECLVGLQEALQSKDMVVNIPLDTLAESVKRVEVAIKNIKEVKIPNFPSEITLSEVQINELLLAIQSIPEFPVSDLEKMIVSLGKKIENIKIEIPEQKEFDYYFLEKRFKELIKAVKGVSVTVSSGGSNAGVEYLKKISENQGNTNPSGNSVISTYLDKFRDEFLTYDTTNNWTTVQTAAGGSISVAGSANGSSYLKINSGTTAGEETIILSKQTFRVPFKVSIGASVTLTSDQSGAATSGRHANLLPIIEVVEVDSNGDVVTTASGETYTGTCPNVLQFAFDGTTVTTQRTTVRGSGTSEVTLQVAMGTASTTLPTGSYPNYIQANNYNMMALTEYVTFQNEPVNSTTVGTSSKKSIRVLDPTKDYAIRIRLKNTGVPAQADFNIHCVRVSDASRVSVDFGLISGNVADNQIAIPVYATNMVSVVYARPSTSYGSSTYSNTISAATTNATSVKASVAVMNALIAWNNSDQEAYLKIYDKASAPTVGTDTPVATFYLPAGFPPTNIMGAFSMRLATGLAFAVTRLPATSDTTAIGANEVGVTINYD